MKQVVQHETYGEITYEESFWIGKKVLYINNQPLKKISKNTFETDTGEIITLKGNYLYGVSATIGSETIQLTAKVKWYEIVLSLIPFIFILFWGNSTALVNIFPIVGGAIGGAIGGLFAMLNLLTIKGVKAVWIKILISLGMFAAAILICFAIAMAIIGAVA